MLPKGLEEFRGNAVNEKHSAKPKENSTPISEMIPSAYMMANVEQLKPCL